jgi:hypothetical protein
MSPVFSNRFAEMSNQAIINGFTLPETFNW